VTRWPAGLALLACLAGCATPDPPPQARAGTPAVTTPASPTFTTGGLRVCRIRGTAADPLPDLGCTPGVKNPAVTADEPNRYRSTICRPGGGYTREIRPPTSYTTTLKALQLFGDTKAHTRAKTLARYLNLPAGVEPFTFYGTYAGSSIAGYEEDHVVPLELGGDADDPANLWPEADASPNPKDRVENEARRRVCAGTLDLPAAQDLIVRDWHELARQLGVSGT
jgi:hypothetical protein